MKQMAGTSDLRPGILSTWQRSFLERHYRMLLTVPGTLPGDPEWGIGINAWIGRKVVNADISALESRAGAAHLRDAETKGAIVKITKLSDGSYEYKATLTMLDGSTVVLNQTVTG